MEDILIGHMAECRRSTCVLVLYRGLGTAFEVGISGNMSRTSLNEMSTEAGRAEAFKAITPFTLCAVSDTTIPTSDEPSM